MSDLDKAVRTVVHECMGVRPNEEVLVVCNPATRELGDALRNEAEAIGAQAVLAVMTERSSHAGEPPATVAEAMVALVLADAVTEKFGGDSVAETRRNLESYLAAIPESLQTAIES